MNVGFWRDGPLPIAISVALFAAGLGLALSCRPQIAKDNPDPKPGMRFSDAASLEPGALPYGRASLILAGTSYPVEVRRSVDGDKITFDFVNHDETIDRENYILDSSGFQIAQGAGLTYEPAIPLVLFPMNVGDKWEWKGEVVAGSERQVAHASMTSEAESLNLESGFYDGFKIQVSLSLQSAGPPIEKRMSFWFVPKQGIVKREFGTTSTRGPLSE